MEDMYDEVAEVEGTGTDSAEVSAMEPERPLKRTPGLEFLDMVLTLPKDPADDSPEHAVIRDEFDQRLRNRVVSEMSATKAARKVFRLDWIDGACLPPIYREIQRAANAGVVHKAPRHRYSPASSTDERLENMLGNAQIRGRSGLKAASKGKNRAGKRHRR